MVLSLLSAFLNFLPDAVGSEWQFRDLHTEGLERVTHRVGHGAGDGTRPALADPTRSQRCIRAGRRRVSDLDVGYVCRRRHLVMLEISRQLLALFVVDELLKHGVRQALHDRAVHLTVDDEGIDNLLQSFGIDGLDKENHFNPNEDDISDWFGGAPGWLRRS